MNIKLKPCPFCGSKVEMVRKPLWDGSHGYHGCYDFKVTCGKCGCTLNYAYADTIYRTEEEAINNVINAWNERKNETSVTLKPKTGHWIWQTEDIYQCSECGEDIHVKEVMNDPQYAWCPICGCPMEIER